MVPTLAAGECQVWWARFDDAREEHLALLPDADRDRRDRLMLPIDRDRLTVGVALSRLVLAAHTGRAPADLTVDRTCPRCGEPHGKPRLVDGGGLEYSVSHAGARVVVAVTRDAPVGVDVESAGPLEPADLAPGVLAEDELAWFRTLPSDRNAKALYGYWTRKEAVLKATGDGLSERLTAIGVSRPVDPPALLRWDGRPDLPGRTYLYDLHPGPAHAACLAVLGGPRLVSESDGGPLLAGWP